MESVQCYIGVRGNPNITELSDVPADKQKLYEDTVWKRVHQRGARPEDALGRPPLADPVDGADGGDEHRGVRGLLLQRLHARLRAR